MCSPWLRRTFSTATSRCSSPIPDRTVWPVSGSVRTTSDGSSSTSRASAADRRPASALLPASTATDTTGAAVFGGSRTSGASGAHSVDPARVPLSPTTATMSPATARSTSACRSAWTRRMRPIRSVRPVAASSTVSPFLIVPE